MFCHNDKSNSTEDSGGSPATKSKIGIAALTGSISALVAPHLLCIAGLGLGGVTIGGYKIYEHSCNVEADFTATEKIPLTKLPAVPDSPKSFSELKNSRAAGLLLESHPVFKEVLEFKRIESKGEPIEIVFMEDEKKDVSVVFCKNGMTCPCSKPQVYSVGSKTDLLSDKEDFSGQHEILSVLYAPELKEN